MLKKKSNETQSGQEGLGVRSEGLIYFVFQGLRFSSHGFGHGTQECTPYGEMETQDSETVGLVRTFISIHV